MPRIALLQAVKRVIKCRRQTVGNYEANLHFIKYPIAYFHKNLIFTHYLKKPTLAYPNFWFDCGGFFYTQAAAGGSYNRLLMDCCGANALTMTVGSLEYKATTDGAFYQEQF